MALVPRRGTLPMSRAVQLGPDLGLKPMVNPQTLRLSWSEVVRYNPGHPLGYVLG